MDNPFIETAVYEYRGKANEVDPDNCNCCRGGSQVSYVSCQHQNREDYHQPDPLPSPSEAVIGSGYLRLRLHTVGGLSFRH